MLGVVACTDAEVGSPGAQPADDAIGVSAEESCRSWFEAENTLGRSSRGSGPQEGTDVPQPSPDGDLALPDYARLVLSVAVAAGQPTEAQTAERLDEVRATARSALDDQARPHEHDAVTSEIVGAVQRFRYHCIFVVPVPESLRSPRP